MIVTPALANSAWIAACMYLSALPSPSLPSQELESAYNSVLLAVKSHSCLTRESGRV